MKDQSFIKLVIFSLTLDKQNNSCVQQYCGNYHKMMKYKHILI